MQQRYEFEDHDGVTRTLKCHNINAAQAAAHRFVLGQSGSHAAASVAMKTVRESTPAEPVAAEPVEEPEEITAYAERHGAKTWYFVLVNGQLRDGYPMKSTKSTYTHIHIQRWDGAPKTEWAARFTASPRPIGSKIEYGYVSEVIPIERPEEALMTAAEQQSAEQSQTEPIAIADHAGIAGLLADQLKMHIERDGQDTDLGVVALFANGAVGDLGIVFASMLAGRDLTPVEQSMLAVALKAEFERVVEEFVATEINGRWMS